ncbi:GTP-binding protein Rhes-like [Huso huso]|uniref:GTP-binding protein Rhes-like n=1 Tax=Huso huso TaxID=61971 RepID=A0ABR0Z0Z8_HUSHU
MRLNKDIEKDMELPTADQVHSSAVDKKNTETDILDLHISNQCSSVCNPRKSDAPQLIMDYNADVTAVVGIKVSNNLGNISKTGMGIIKNVTGQWKHQDRKSMRCRSASSHPAVDRNSKRFNGQFTSVHMHNNPSSSSPLESPCPGCIQRVKPENSRRLVVMGAPKVGKSSIVGRFLKGSFDEQYVPTTEDFHRKLYQIKGENYQLDILDASGERSFPAKRRLTILTGDIFLLVCSLDDKESFEEVCSLLNEIIEAKKKLMKSKDDVFVPTVVCGNKLDTEPFGRAVTREDVSKALGQGSVYFETSAKDNTNMEEMFQALVERAGLPMETSPSHHRSVSVRSFQKQRQPRGRGGKENLSPCGAVYPCARRPSFSTDLQTIVGPSLPRKRSKPLEKCHIQ